MFQKPKWFSDREWVLWGVTLRTGLVLTLTGSGHRILSSDPGFWKWLVLFTACAILMIGRPFFNVVFRELEEIMED